MKFGLRVLAMVILAAALLAAGLYFLGVFNRETSVVRLGISPYQDTAMPVIARTEGFFEQEGVNVELETIQWENVIPALASSGRTVDVAIGSINTFLPRATAVNSGREDPVIFYAPLYVFKGASLVARRDSGLTPYRTLLARHHGNRTAALREMMTQLRGKRLGLPSGTPYDQMFLQAVREGGGDRTALDVRDVQIADALPALLSGNLDVAAAGVTQRTEAARQGHYVLIETEDLGFAEIVGLVARRSYIETHRAELEAIRRAWFRSIRLLNSNPRRASSGVLAYLAQNASTRYTFEEYMQSLRAQEFPPTQAAADQMFNSPSGRFYWRRTWDIVNVYLIQTGKAREPISYDYFYTAGGATQ